MGAIDRDAPVRFLRTAFEANDAIGVLLKHYGSGHVVQRMVPVTTAASARFQAWLRHMNARAWNVYVPVNAYRPGRSRAREAVSTVRHLFIEEDRDGPALLAALSTRPDLPPASYVLHSSPGRVHVLWRVRDIPPSRIERLQKRLARELSTDRAATSCAQTTRLPGFVNHKRQPVVRVEIEYLHGRDVYSSVDLPDMPQIEKGASSVTPPPVTSRCLTDRVERATAFLARVDPAIAGQQGDLRTFRVCCRVVRGFALSDNEALAALAAWNARCDPPWSPEGLARKVANARKYGTEREGGLL